MSRNSDSGSNILLGRCWQQAAKAVAAVAAILLVLALVLGGSGTSGSTRNATLCETLCKRFIT